MATDPGQGSGGQPVVAVFRGPLFNPSEQFVQLQAASLRRYRPLIVGLERIGNVIPALEGRILSAPSVRRRFAIRLLGQWGELSKRVSAEQPSLVHAHFAPDGLAALSLARALRVPLVTSLRGYDVTRSRAALLRSGRLSWIVHALLRSRLMAHGDLFLAVSHALRRRALARGYPAERTLTHYNGVDLVQFRPSEGSPEPGLILFVGRLVEKKGVGELLAAFAAAKAEVPEARLRIIGEGPLLGALRRQAEALGIAGSVEFAGALRAVEVAAEMRRAWLLAAPSRTARDGDSEGLPNTVVEAAASGLPVVATDHGGIPEAVSHGVSGFLVPEGEADLLARRLVELLRDADMRGQMGRKARAIAEERFDLRRQAERLEAIYDSVVAAARTA